MKRLNVVIFLLIGLLLFTSCNCKSCRKGLEYKYVGAYIKVIDVEKISMNDRNLKVYNEEEKNIFTDYNGIYEYQITNTKTRYITEDDEAINYDFSASYTVSNNLEEVTIYPIVYNEDNGYQILTDDKTVLKLVENDTKTTTIYKYYIYKKQNYNFKFTLKFYRKAGY